MAISNSKIPEQLNFGEPKSEFKTETASKPLGSSPNPLPESKKQR
jgi:hypothetical protein